MHRDEKHQQSDNAVKLQQHNKVKRENEPDYLYFEDGYLSFDVKKQRFNVVLEAPPIKNLVLAGGGPRGIAYPGVLQALEETRVSHCVGSQTFMQQLDALSGASIGAVLAAHAACGMRSRELKKQVPDLDFEKLLGNSWTPFLRDSVPLYQMMQKNFPESIRMRLLEIMGFDRFDPEAMRDYFFQEKKRLTDKYYNSLNQLMDELEKILIGGTPVITFKMLRSLHVFSPTIFKDLYVSVTFDGIGGEYLSADTAPDVEIALACRGSAAIPGIVKPIPIEKRFLTFYQNKPEVPNVLSMRDGGFADNHPFEAVDTKQKKEIGFNVGEHNQNLQTLIVMPDDTIAVDYNTDMEIILDIAAKRYDLSLLSLEENEPLSKITRDKAERDKRPILIKRGEQFSIYGHKNNKWQETILRDLPDVEAKLLQALPFNEELIKNDDLGSPLYQILKRHHKPNFTRKLKKYPQSPLLNNKGFSTHELAPPSFLLDFISDFISKIFGLVKASDTYTKKREENLLRLRREFSPRTIPLQSGLSFVDFEKAKKYADPIMKYSRYVTHKYLKQHRSECVFFSYDKLPDLLKNLPDSKYAQLLTNIEKHPLLKEVNFNKIDQLREKHRKIPASKWPKFNNFMQDFYTIILELNLKNDVIRRLRENFYIISIDDNPDDNMKMLRTLSVIFDNLPELKKESSAPLLLSFFSDHFVKYLRFPAHQTIEEINARKNKILITDVTKEQHYQIHQFHVIYQRIIFLLKKTKSSLQNPQDMPHQRKFIDIILNDMQTISEYSINEQDKLKMLEEYIFRSYHQAVFHKGAAKGNIVTALKEMVESKNLLNLPFQYGIELPAHVKKMPTFPVGDLLKNRLVSMAYEKKLAYFMQCFRNTMHFTASHSVKTSVFPSLAKHIFENFVFDPDKEKIMCRAVVRTMMCSPDSEDTFFAKRLNELITPQDIVKDTTHHRSLFYAVSLLTRLTWTTPNEREIVIYNKLLAKLNILINDYHDEQQGMDRLMSILQEYYNVLRTIDSKNGMMSFFFGHNRIYLLIENFIEKDLRVTVEKHAVSRFVNQRVQ